MQDVIRAMLGEPVLGLILLFVVSSVLPLLDARPLSFVMMCVASCKEGCPRLSRNLLFQDLAIKMRLEDPPQFMLLSLTLKTYSGHAVA